MDRRAIRDAWKEKAPDAGIYAIRAGRECWVGATMRLAAAEQRLRFAIRTGAGGNAALAAASRAGDDARFEVLETLDADLSPLKRDRLLKERAAHWRETLGARPV